MDFVYWNCVFFCIGDGQAEAMNCAFSNSMFLSIGIGEEGGRGRTLGDGAWTCLLELCVFFV
jgi:hypothetical protein